MTILLFLAALAVLVLSHEAGHFVSAKISKMRVDEFGFGFPPRLLGFKRRGTLYSLNLIPFGGFVKIFGEDSTDGEPGSFASKPIYKRALVLATGVFFNLILAWLLFSLAYAVGAPTAVPDSTADAKVTLLEIQEGTPAQSAGFQPGDQLLKMSSKEEVLEVQTVEKVQDFIARHKGQEIVIDYLRGKSNLSAKARLDAAPGEGKGSLGIVMGKIGIESLPLHKSLWEGLKDTVFLTGAIVKAFVGLITTLIKGGNVGVQVMGPVGIVGVVGTAADFGFVYVVQLIALLSINLAIINFLPFPALDGGRLLFLAIEAVKGTPVSQKVANTANTIGFFILIGLMILITFRDVSRLIF